MSNFSAIQVLLQWDDDADDGVHFVLDQHALLNCYRASSLKQQSEGRHVSSLGTHYPDFEPISLCLLLNDECLGKKQEIPIL